MKFRFGLIHCFIAFFCFSSLAQPDIPGYKGLRVSLFDVTIKKQKSESISLKFSIVNTGRLPVSVGNKGGASPEGLVIELDTINLPTPLQGRENLLTEAVRKEKINLQPGEILQNQSVEIKLKAPGAAAIQPGDQPQSGSVCADLVFDTAIIVRYTDDAMSLQFIIRNAGKGTALLLGNTDSDDDNLAINVYFTTGTKLTRGSILANGTFIRKGRETLDGLLLPGQKLQGEIDIKLDKRTKFAPNLVFELDPFQSLDDCNRSNNTKPVVVEF